MPIRYVQTLGAVAGIPTVVNAVVIDCDKPTSLALAASGRPSMTISAAKHQSLALAASGRPGLTVAASKPAPLVITMTPTLTRH